MSVKKKSPASFKSDFASFFSDINLSDKKFVKTSDWQKIVYILSKECGWTQKDIFETDIPFIMDFLEGRRFFLEEERKEYEKASKK